MTADGLNMPQGNPRIIHRREARPPKRMGAKPAFIQPYPLECFPEKPIGTGFVDVSQPMTTSKQVRIFAPDFNMRDIFFQIFPELGVDLNFSGVLSPFCVMAPHDQLRSNPPSANHIAFK